MQTLDSSVAAAQLADRQAAAAASRAAHDSAPVAPPALASREPLVLRRSASWDAAALTRLAQLDGAPTPTGAMLVAELGDEIVAAVPFEGGRAIADPFRPTAAIVELLHARTRLLAGGAPAGRLQRLRPHLRMRIAA
ncbi:MAG: hypothetical protein QOC68_2019 [Solirubrobacteraceae bacterium]|jgi:hypothetical protein|nr:hypothetical protein [Solirubrobacteraceae bacterium]